SHRVVVITDQRTQPAHYRSFHLCRGRGRSPRGDAGIKRRGQQISETSGRRRRRGDIAKETWMTVVAAAGDDRTTVIDQRFKWFGFNRQRRIESLGDCFAGKLGRDWSIRNGAEIFGREKHEFLRQLPTLLICNIERRGARYGSLIA